MSDPDLTTAGAKKALEAGDWREAVACLLSQCRAPGFHEDPDALGEAMGVLAEACPLFGDEELQPLASSVRESPSDVQALYDLGWALVERQLFEMASAVP